MLGQVYYFPMGNQFTIPKKDADITHLLMIF